VVRGAGILVLLGVGSAALLALGIDRRVETPAPPQLQPDELPFDPATETCAGQTVAELLAQARDNATEHRLCAVISLGFAGAGCQGLSPMYLGPSRAERLATLHEVRQGHVMQRARIIVPVLTAALRDPAVEVRCAAAAALMTVGPDALAAEPQLRAALRDDDEGVRARSARALYFVCQDVPTAIDASVALLRSQNPSTRVMAVYNLECMGPDGSAARPFVEEMLQDPDEHVRGHARQALEQPLRWSGMEGQLCGTSARRSTRINDPERVMSPADRRSGRSTRSAARDGPRRAAR
jgi:hypothetical protein